MVPRHHLSFSVLSCPGIMPWHIRLGQNPQCMSCHAQCPDLGCELQCLELPVQADSYIEALCTASVSPAGRRIIPACFKLFIWNHCRLVLNFVLSLSFTLPFGLKDLRLRTQPYLPLHTWSKDSCSSCILKASDPFYPILTKCFCRVFIADCRKEAENTPPVTVKGELNPTL